MNKGIYVCLCLALCACNINAWYSAVILFTQSSSSHIASSFMDPTTFITHMIVKEDHDTVYMHVESGKEVTVARSLHPLNRLFTFGNACMSVDGQTITIVSSLRYASQKYFDLWYMMSYDGGYTWTDYQKIFRIPDRYEVDHRLHCPLVYVKETKRLVVISSVYNISGYTQPLMLAIASKPANSNTFGLETIIGTWEQYKDVPYVNSVYTYANKSATLHTFTYGNDSLIYLQSKDNGVHWTKPRVIAAKATMLNDALHVVTRGPEIYLTFEKDNSSPITMIVSKDNGNSWKNKYTITDKKISGPFSFMLCNINGVEMLHHFVSYEPRSTTLYRWNLDTFEREVVSSPFNSMAGGVNGTYLECTRNPKTKVETKIAFTNVKDMDKHHFVVSYGSDTK